MDLYTVEIGSGGPNEWLPDYRYVGIGFDMSIREADKLIAEWEASNMPPNFRIRKRISGYRPTTAEILERV